MRCPKCGNEVSPGEAFCGQCGTSVSSPVHPTEMVYTPQSGQLSGYNGNNGQSATPVQRSGMLPPPNVPAGPRQQTGFYQDATEAMTSLPNSGGPQQGNYAGTGQYNPQPQVPQPFAGNGYTQHGGYSQVPPFVPGQSYAGYGMPPHVTPPPQKQASNSVLVVASVLLALALIAVIVFGAIYFTRSHTAPQAGSTPVPVATTVPTSAITSTPVATTVPTSTSTALAGSTPTVADTPTPTPIPSPPVSTPAPDANFSWCGTNCTANGFMVEYPNGWNQGQVAGNGVQFLDPTHQDVYANFKAPGAQANANAGTLVDTDLQTNYASQPGYVPPTAKQVTTIGNETWTYAIASYSANNTKERVEVFATVHLGKSYIIELQAPDSQFDALNTQYFEIMINRFQFVQSTT